ncbi:splicing factor 3B subunit 4-like [Dipodomys spectabilis]|uniref:splicing factor 3B subunit 4-like n=1 Tax=Dipodomys spectabilis TaxID=105255 RepID=UPI001C5401C9|nr:splicing factor 3B subunit 4-like [Dipodomys spectabilis]
MPSGTDTGGQKKFTAERACDYLVLTPQAGAASTTKPPGLRPPDPMLPTPGREAAGPGPPSAGPASRAQTPASPLGRCSALLLPGPSFGDPGAGGWASPLCTVLWALLSPSERKMAHGLGLWRG